MAHRQTKFKLKPGQWFSIPLFIGVLAVALMAGWFAFAQDDLPALLPGKSPDFDDNGIVGFADFLLFSPSFGKASNQAGYQAKYDLNNDNTVEFADFFIFADYFGKKFEQEVQSVAISSPDSACDNKWRMAFIILNKEGDTVPESIKNEAEAVRRDFPAYFYEATSKLGTMDTSDTVYILNIPNEMINYQQGNVHFALVTKKFYQNYPDNFDFLAFYTVFPSTGEFHYPIVLNITGMGRETLDMSISFGSNHKLKGVTFFNNSLSTFDYNETNGKNNIINGLLHEIGHHWCCYIGDNFAKGENNAQLEIKQQGIHFYRGLQSPTATGDPMDSDNWVSNNNGTYRRQNEPGIGVYHPFQLYFMGLLPTMEYSVKHVLYNAGVVGQDFHPENATFYKEISVDDIIAVEGQRTCTEP